MKRVNVFIGDKQSAQLGMAVMDALYDHFGVGEQKSKTQLFVTRSKNPGIKVEPAECTSEIQDVLAAAYQQHNEEVPKAFVANLRNWKEPRCS